MDDLNFNLNQKSILSLSLFLAFCMLHSSSHSRPFSVIFNTRPDSLLYSHSLISLSLTLTLILTLTLSFSQLFPINEDDDEKMMMRDGEIKDEDI